MKEETILIMVCMIAVAYFMMEQHPKVVVLNPNNKGKTTKTKVHPKVVHAVKSALASKKNNPITYNQIMQTLEQKGF